VVTKPQNVMVMRDIACAGYVAGGNCRWFAKDPEDGDFSAKTARDQIMSRLSFADDVTDKYASMLAFPAHEGQFTSGQLDTVMSVTTRILPWEVTGSATHDSFPGGDKMYAKYASALNLGQIHYGEDMKSAENQDFISQGSTNNATCFLGPHRKYDPFTKTFMSLTPGQGHFGPDAIPGDARWRRGKRPRPQTAPALAAAPLTAPPHKNFRRERVFEDGPRFDDLARAGPARADGLLGAPVSRRRRPRCARRKRYGQRAPPFPHLLLWRKRVDTECVRVRCVCVCACTCVGKASLR
jgi:hypothetical protein